MSVIPSPKPVTGFSNFKLVRSSPAPNNVFLGSDAVCLHKGERLVSSDDFGAGAVAGTTHIDVYNSGTGLYQARLATLSGMFWGRFLDFDPNTLYLWGTSQENGSIVVAKSTNSGAAWTKATIIAGNFHCAPTNYAIHGDYVYTTMERVNMGAPVGTVGTGRPIAVRAYRARLDSDLLNPASWSQSNEIVYDNAFFGGFEILEFNIINYKGELHLFGRTLYNESMPHLKLDPVTMVLTRISTIPCPWAWSKFSVEVCPLTGHILVAGNQRHAPHNNPPNGSVDEDRTWARLWMTKDLFQTYTPVFDFFDFGEPYWRSKGGQYPSLYFPKVNGIPTGEMWVGLRVGIFSNSPHNSSETKVAVYQNYTNLLNP